jgi:hypothetical protein
VEEALEPPISPDMPISETGIVRLALFALLLGSMVPVSSSAAVCKNELKQYPRDVRGGEATALALSSSASSRRSVEPKRATEFLLRMMVVAARVLTTMRLCSGVWQPQTRQDAGAYLLDEKNDAFDDAVLGQNREYDEREGSYVQHERHDSEHVVFHFVFVGDVGSRNCG